ncbi:hypothetical protein [Chitinophaga sp. S165]|uniref:hypothetical protein n=1 Tax=Chitinophaga sp. S165 TaxID=2135462 RepID=UPI000D71BF6C|nr:hypothetical protein [Chitinophaga sp. S165]PWV51615.1 hypothetical protein C7475_103225 [Chitinophaga sp. S165]
MPKFVGGPPPFVGTRDNLTIYLMNGEYIVRTKSSLTGKRVKRDPAFARTMENAGRLKKASRIASVIYKQIPADLRVYKQYRELVGKAMGLLKNGFDVEYVLVALEVTYLADCLSDCSSHLSQGDIVLPVASNVPEQKHVWKSVSSLFKTSSKEHTLLQRMNASRSWLLGQAFLFIFLFLV